MTNWKYTLNFRDLITDETLNEDQSIIRAKAMANRVNTFVERYSNNSEDGYMVYDLMDVRDSLKDAISMDEINECLDMLYDAADTYRIWIE